jgi:hypothetical protein
MLTRRIRFVYGLLLSIFLFAVIPSGLADVAHPSASDKYSVMASAGEKPPVVLAAAEQQAGGHQENAKAPTAGADKSTAESRGTFGFILGYLAANPFAYLFLALALGYPLGRIKVGGISLGATAGPVSVGALYASSPTTDSRRGIALPFDRIISVGAGVEQPCFGLACYANISYVDLGDGHVSEDGGPPLGSVEGSFSTNWPWRLTFSW